MREDKINKAVNFLQSKKVEGISQDQQIEFLKTQLTEEELSEALKRYEDLKQAKTQAKVDGKSAHKEVKQEVQKSK